MATAADHNDSMLEDLCKTLSELELRAYLGGGSSGSVDHVITTNDVDDDKELELLLSPSKSAGHKNSDLNNTTNRSLKHKFIENNHRLENSMDDVNTIATMNKLKVRTHT